MKQRVTISDVAKAAGVSKQTVSRAINDKGEINPETKSRILEIVKQLDYHPSRIAQGLNTQRTYAVGVVVGDIANPFFPDIIRGIQDHATANDYNVFLCNSDDNPDTEMRMLKMLAAQEVDGIIVYSGQSHPEDLRNFADSYRPIILINRHLEHPHISLIQVDTYRGAQLVADYFIRRQRTAIGLLMPIIDSRGRLNRIKGFKDQLQAYGQILPDEKIFIARPNLEGGYQTTHQLLDKYPDTNAIFAYNDLMALGSIRACRERNLHIPQDIAVMGFDDIKFAAMASPSLTTIRIDKYQVGQAAMRRLLEMIEDDHGDFPPVTIGVELVSRESA